MDEKNQDKTTPFDAEWELRKLSGRIMDIMDIIDELKSKDKSLSARISRLRITQIEEEGEEEAPERERERPDIEDMTIEQRALLYSELLDRINPQR